MSTSILTSSIIEKLLSAGYLRIETPFRVASVEFEFTAVFRGPEARGLDLVLLLDTAVGDHGETEGDRVLNRIEALGRALDISGSKFAMTAIFSGAPLGSQILERVSGVCRVLNVNEINISDRLTPVQSIGVDDQIRSLLPLALDTWGTTSSKDREPFDLLTQSLPETVDDVLRETVLKASSRGEAAVLHVLATRIKEALDAEGSE